MFQRHHCTPPLLSSEQGPRRSSNAQLQGTPCFHSKNHFGETNYMKRFPFHVQRRQHCHSLRLLSNLILPYKDNPRHRVISQAVLENRLASFSRNNHFQPPRRFFSTSFLLPLRFFFFVDLFASGHRHLRLLRHVVTSHLVQVP